MDLFFKSVKRMRNRDTEAKAKNNKSFRWIRCKFSYFYAKK